MKNQRIIIELYLNYHFRKEIHRIRTPADKCAIHEQAQGCWNDKKNKKMNTQRKFTENENGKKRQHEIR